MREEKYVSKNGVNIYSYKNPAQSSFHISLFVKSGSMHEREGERGITHFLEHISIRNVNRLMGSELYTTLDENGLELGASTFSEMVQFYIHGARENFSLGAEIICKLLLPITLERADIDAERARIKAEIRESGDKTSLLGFTSKIVFHGTPLSESIAGNIASVNKITGARLEAYRRSVMTSENIFLYVTGNFDEENIGELLKTVASYNIERGEMRRNIAKVPPDFCNRAGGVYIKNGDFTMARFTFDLDMNELSVAEADLLYDILLSGYSSPLFYELSERRGLFYDVSGNLERYLNIGTLAFYYELRESSLYDAVEMTVELLNRMKKEVLPSKRLMKAGYTDNAYMLYDDARELNFTFGYDNHIMNLGYADIDERRSAYESVTPERIRELSELIFTPERLTFTVKGKKRSIDTERLKKILAKLYLNENGR